MPHDDRTDPEMTVRGAQRLTETLVRWATASRSGIVAVPKDGVDLDNVHAYGDVHEKTWDFRPFVRGGGRGRDGSSPVKAGAAPRTDPSGRAAS